MHPSAEAVALVPPIALAYAFVAPRGTGSRAQVAAAAAGARADPRRVRGPAPAARGAHVPLGAPAPERRPRGVGAGAARARDPAGVAARAARFPLFRPFVALPLWLVTYFAWHLPWIYDYALRHPHSLLHVEHLTYLLAGSASGGRSSTAPIPAGLKALYLFAAFVLASPLGLMLALVQRPVYSFYVHAPRTWGPAPLADQQIAGVTMAAEEATVFFVVFTLYLLRFLRDEQAQGAFEGIRGRDGW